MSLSRVWHLSSTRCEPWCTYLVVVLFAARVVKRVCWPVSYRVVSSSCCVVAAACALSSSAALVGEAQLVSDAVVQTQRVSYPGTAVALGTEQNMCTIVC